MKPKKDLILSRNSTLSIHVQHRLFPSPPNTSKLSKILSLYLMIRYCEAIQTMCALFLGWLSHLTKWGQRMTHAVPAWWQLQSRWSRWSGACSAKISAKWPAAGKAAGLVQIHLLYERESVQIGNFERSRRNRIEVVADIQ